MRMAADRVCVRREGLIGNFNILLVNGEEGNGRLQKEEMEGRSFWER